MKSKVIIFCVLLYCSEFAVSIPFPEESVQQRAYQPNNWQGNQNINENYRGNGFAQAQNLNAHRHDHSHEFINQERQNFNNYGFNNNPALLPSPPIKESQTFASETNERKFDNLPAKGDSLPNRPGNRVGNYQYRQNNWQAQNNPTNVGASAIGILGAERPLSTVQEPYRAPGQYSQFIPPSSNRGAINQRNQPDTVDPAVRETRYHPFAERPTNVRYQNLGTNPELNNRHVNYGNHNDAQSATNKNIAESGNNDFIENSPLYSAPVNTQSSEGYNGSPAVMSDTSKYAGNQQMQHGYRNTNVPKAYNIARPLPDNKQVANENNRYMRNPAINSAPINQMPSNKYEVPNMLSNTALNNAGHNRYLQNGPKSAQPVNKHRYEQNPAFSNFNNGGLNVYNGPLVPNNMEMEQNKYEDKPVFDSGSDYQPPVNSYNEPGSPPNDSIKSGSEENPLNQPAMAESTYGETPNFMSGASQPVPDSAPNSDSQYESGPAAHPPKNVYNHFYPGPDRGYMENDEKLKDLFAPNSRFVLIHKNGTVKHFNNMEEIGKNNQNYIIVKKKDIPTNNDEYKSLLTSDPFKNSLSYDKVPTEKYPELSNKPGYSPSLQPINAKDNNLNQPHGLRHPYYNGYPPSPIPQPPENNEYNPPLGPQTPNSNENYAPSGLQSTNSDEYYSKPESLSPYNNEHYPSQRPSNKEGKQPTVTQSPTDEAFDPLNGLQSPGENKDNSQAEMLYTNKYHSGNRMWDTSYPSSTPQQHAQRITTTTKAPDDNPPPDVSRKTYNDTIKKQPSFVPATSNDDIIESQNNENRGDDITKPSKLHTHISPSIFKSTTPTLSESSNKKPPLTPIPAIPSIYKTTTVESFDDIQEFLDSLSGAPHKTSTPSSFTPSDDDNKNPTPIPDSTEWDDDHTTASSTLHTRISPGIFESTTPDPEQNVQDLSDSAVETDNKTTTAISPTDDDNKNKQNNENKHPEQTSEQSDLNSHDKHESAPSSCRKDNIDKKPVSKPSSPTSDYDSSSSELLVQNDSQEYNSTRDDDTTNPPSKLHTYTPSGIYSSTTSSEEQIQQFSENSDDAESSKPKNKKSSPASKSENRNSTLPPESNSTSADVTTTSPVERTTEDTISTISPIELQTDNVKNGSATYPEDEVTPAYNERSATTSNTPSPTESDNLDQVIITIMSDNKNKTSEVKSKDSKTDKSTRKASVPVTPDDSSAVASNSTKENNTNTGDNSATGDDLLESRTNTSDIVITLTKESDGNVTIKVEVPESTGPEDSSGNDALVVSINTKNCSADDAVTVKKAETANEGTNKNLVIDLSHSAIFFNQTTEKDIFDEVLQSAPGSVVYVFQIKPQPIIERNKTTIIYANNTVVEEISETTWQSKDDASPTVITTKKVYHQGAKY